MASVCVLTLCGLPAAGKTTFATSFNDYLQQADTPRVNGSDLAEKQDCSSSMSYRVIHIDYDELIPSEIDMSLTDDSEQFTVIITFSATLHLIGSIRGQQQHPVLVP